MRPAHGPRTPWLLFLAVAAACGPERPIFHGPAFESDPPPLVLSGRLVSTNNGDDTLTVIDPVARIVLGRVPVGLNPVELEGPHHLAADPLGAAVYVNLSEAVTGSGSGPHGAHGTGEVPGYALKLEPVGGRMLGFTRVDPNPGDNVLTPDGATLAVTHYDLLKWQQAVTAGDIRLADSNLVLVDTAAMEVSARVPLCPLAHGARLSADGRTLFASCATDELAEVRLSERPLAVRRTLLPGRSEQLACSRCPYAVSVAPDGMVWVSSLGPRNGSSGGGGVDVYDPAAQRFDPARSVTLCGRALFAAFGRVPGSAGDFRVYVPEQGCAGFPADAVRVYQPGGPGVAPTEVAQIPLSLSQCLNAHMLTISDDGRTAQLICEGDHRGAGSIVFLNLETSTVVSTATIGVFPDGLVLVPTPPT